MKYKIRYVLFGKMKGVEYFMKLPDQLKDIVYRLLQEPTLDNFRNFLKGQTGSIILLILKKMDRTDEVSKRNVGDC